MNAQTKNGYIHFLSCSCVRSTLWMHVKGFNETNEEESQMGTTQE